MSNFQDLPNELVLIILKSIETKDLISCGQVSQRIRKISQEDSLWATANLEKKIVKTELIEMILSKGCKILNLSNSTILGNLSLNIKSQLRYLNLSQHVEAWPGQARCIENIEVLEELVLFSCHSLQHLTIEGVMLTPKMAVSICKNSKTLQTLNLNHGFIDEKKYSFVDDSRNLTCLEKILKYCQELKKVNTIDILSTICEIQPITGCTIKKGWQENLMLRYLEQKIIKNCRWTVPK